MKTSTVAKMTVAAAVVGLMAACTTQLKEEDKALMNQAISASQDASTSAKRAEAAADRAEAAASRAEAAADKAAKMFQKGMRK